MEAGLDNPLEGNFGVKNLKRGIARQLGSPPKQKMPITSQIMMEIYNLLTMSTPKEIAFWACCCVGLFGFLRKATLLPISVQKIDSCILRGDLEFLNNESFVLNIRKTKTIQNHERVLVMPFVAVPGTVFCPVDAVMNMLIVSPIADDMPLFSFLAGDV